MFNELRVLKAFSIEGIFNLQWVYWGITPPYIKEDLYHLFFIVRTFKVYSLNVFLVQHY